MRYFKFASKDYSWLLLLYGQFGAAALPPATNRNISETLMKGRCRFMRGASEADGLVGHPG
ncbi:hypothetical protein QTL95_03575 [Rhizobium sp. S152]|uniref:hypothetical protein n=1 Tax=Rhizobium sp. S152 TaxID=3055038 RepID=UPI0025A9D1F0|nr:hypothetical protein [Rhizobium sp. S152]MDM9624964.1 hypothetical protein [Rhizobium sp. S152]